jgi:hypothetical protein
MALPWLRLLDMAIGVTDVARVANLGRGRRESASSNQEQLDADQEATRLDLERQLLEAERRRAERALQLDLQRQAGDREIGRLRLLAGVAVASWIGTLILSARIAGVGARVFLGLGWLFLLCAIAVSFVGQSRAAARVDALAVEDDGRVFRSGVSGAFALWLIILGLVFAGLAALIA